MSLSLQGFREKNRDLMRQDVVNALKNSKSAFVRELVGTDPVAVFRWAVVRAAFRALFAFKQAGRNMHKAGKPLVYLTRYVFAEELLKVGV